MAVLSIELACSCCHAGSSWFWRRLKVAVVVNNVVKLDHCGSRRPCCASTSRWRQRIVVLSVTVTITTVFIPPNTTFTYRHSVMTSAALYDFSCATHSPCGPWELYNSLIEFLDGWPKRPLKQVLVWFGSVHMVLVFLHVCLCFCVDGCNCVYFGGGLCQSRDW